MARLILRLEFRAPRGMEERPVETVLHARDIYKAKRGRGLVNAVVFRETPTGKRRPVLLWDCFLNDEYPEREE